MKAVAGLLLIVLAAPAYGQTVTQSKTLTCTAVVNPSGLPSFSSSVMKADGSPNVPDSRSKG